MRNIFKKFIKYNQTIFSKEVSDTLDKEFKSDMRDYFTNVLKIILPIFILVLLLFLIPSLLYFIIPDIILLYFVSIILDFIVLFYGIGFIIYISD